tara:strand:- start:627 stop:821 length:195 start_codon:yes stop_codon:yes gene_type:complete
VLLMKQLYHCQHFAQLRGQRIVSEVPPRLPAARHSLLQQIDERENPPQVLYIVVLHFGQLLRDA